MIWEKLSDPSHPLWKLLRLVVVCIAILIVFSLAYSHPLSSVDIMPTIAILATLAGYDQVKAIVTGERKHE